MSQGFKKHLKYSIMTAVIFGVVGIVVRKALNGETK